MAPQILCISFSPLKSDARVLRQISVLASMGEVTTVGYGPKPAGATRHIEIPGELLSLPRSIGGVMKLALRAHTTAECSSPAAKWVLEQQIPKGWNLVVANDARALDVAHRLAGDAPIWADMHEWAPEEQGHIPIWRLLVAPFMTHLCKKYLPEASLVTTVSKGIAELYEEEFDAPAKLLMNAGPYKEIQVKEPAADTIACVHSGVGISGRGLRLMIDVIIALPERFTLDLYLMPGGDGGAHLRELKEAAAGCDRITFHDPVAPHELPGVLSQYDMGLFWIPPTYTNARLTLPNKFFDFVQARLGVAIGPSAEMAREVEKYGLGIVSSSFEFEDILASINEITTEDVVRMKQHADAAAHSLSFEEQVRPIKEELRELIGSRNA